MPGGTDSRPTRTSYRSPWQNGVAERWVGNVRSELLDHAVVFNERHLRRLLADYVAYYHDDRTHWALEKRTPGGRLPSASRGLRSAIVASRRLAGLHHRYDWAAYQLSTEFWRATPHPAFGGAGLASTPSGHATGFDALRARDATRRPRPSDLSPLKPASRARRQSGSLRRVCRQSLFVPSTRRRRPPWARA